MIAQIFIPHDTAETYRVMASAHRGIDEEERRRRSAAADELLRRKERIRRGLPPEETASAGSIKNVFDAPAALSRTESETAKHFGMSDAQAIAARDVQLRHPEQTSPPGPELSAAERHAAKLLGLSDEQAMAARSVRR